MTLSLNLTDKAQRGYDRAVDSLDYLVQSEGEPAIGGEQYYNRLFLDAVADEITGIFGDLPPAAGYIDRALYLTQGIFRELCKYREVDLEMIKGLRDILAPYKSKPAVRVIERPQTVRVIDPVPEDRAFALQAPREGVEMLAQELGLTVTGLTKALAWVEERGYVLAKRV